MISAYNVGDSIPLAAQFLNRTGASLTGSATMVVEIFRAADGYFIDWNDGTFKASGWTTKQAALAEVSSSNAPGWYKKSSDWSTVGVAPGSYFVTYRDTSASAGNSVQQDEIRLGDAATSIASGTASAGSANSITLAGASSTDGFYKRQNVAIIGGTGVGQVRPILHYVGSTKVATVGPAWATNPDSTSRYSVTTSFNVIFIDCGLAQAGGATSITLVSTSSATDDLYVGCEVAILSGTGAGQTRIITAYNGTTKVATLATAWATNPDSTSAYILLPVGRSIVVSNLDKTGYTASVGAGGITSASFATDAITADALKADAASEIATSVLGTAVPGAFVAGTLGYLVGNNLLAPNALRTGTAQAGGANSITLDSGASSTDNLYRYNLVTITSGTGAGQSNTILGYTGSSKVALVARNWLTNPDNTSVFAIVADAQPLIVVSGAISSATSSTATLGTGASSVDSFYNGAILFIRGGTGAGQARMITGYVGSTKVATIDEAWSTTPDSTSGYEILPFGRARVATIESGAVTNAAFASNAIDSTVLAPNAIGTSQIAAGAITSSEAPALANLDVAVSAARDAVLAKLPAALIGGRIDATVGAMQNDVLTSAALAGSAVAEIQAGLATSAGLPTPEVIEVGQTEVTPISFHYVRNGVPVTGADVRLVVERRNNGVLERLDWDAEIFRDPATVIDPSIAMFEVNATYAPGVYDWTWYQNFPQNPTFPDVLFFTVKDGATILARYEMRIRTVDTINTIAAFGAPPDVTSIATGVWNTSLPGAFVAGKAGYYLDARVSTVPGLVWDELTASHTTANTFGRLIGTNLDSTVSGVPAAVWASAGRTLSNGAITTATFGAGAIDAAAFAQGAADRVWSTAARTLTAFTGAPLASVVGGVWGEALPGAYGVGTAGKLLASASAPDAATVAAAVWDLATAGHGSAGTFGALTIGLNTGITAIQGAGFTAGVDDLHSLRARGDAAWATPATVVLTDASLSAAKLGAGFVAAIQAAILDDATPFHGASIASILAFGAPPSAAVISTQVASDLATAHGVGSWATATGFAIPGDAMTLTGAERSAIQATILSDATPFPGARVDAAITSRSTLTAAQVWTADISANATLTQAGGALYGLKILGFNRMEETAGNPGTILVYADDGSTLRFSFTLRDTTGGAVTASAGEPARRSAVA